MKYTILLFILLMLVAPFYTYAQHNDEDTIKIIILNDSNFYDVIGKSKQLVILDFFATWCGPCKWIEPYMEKLAQKYSSRIDFYKIDVDSSVKISKEFSIKSIPTIIILQNGNFMNAIVGANPLSIYESNIESILKSN